MARKKPVGWRGEPVRHGQAARGIKTNPPERRDAQYKERARKMEEKARRLEDIQGEMDDLLEEAFDLLRGTGEAEAARGYWYAHIKGALDKEGSGFLGGSMIDMQQTIEDVEMEAESLRAQSYGGGERGILLSMIAELKRLDEPGAHKAAAMLRSYSETGSQDALKKAIEVVEDESDRDWYTRRQRDMLLDMSFGLSDMVKS